MMSTTSQPVYRTPGVYVEWPDVNAQYLDVGRTDIAGFIGIAARGPLHTAVKIESARQFQTTFGDPIDQGYLAYAVDGFFANGGRTCWIVRVADPAQAALARLRVHLPNMTPVVVQASSEGTWGNEITIEPIIGEGGLVGLLAKTPDGLTQTIPMPPPSVPGRGTLQPGTLQPLFTNLLGIDSALLSDLATLALVTIAGDDPTLPLVAIGAGTAAVVLSGGTDGLRSLTPFHFGGDRDSNSSHLWGIDALARVDGISFVAAPDLVYTREPPELPLDFNGFSNSNDVLTAQIAIINRCIACRDRIALLDPPRRLALLDPALARDQVEKYRAQLPPVSFAAFYYPWIVVTDTRASSRGSVRVIPPSGHIAGVFARTDRLRGVHKPPANELLETVWDVSEGIDDAVHGELNDMGINAVRSIAGRGLLVLGARTLAADIRWRYVNVRRLFAMIETAIERQMQWVTFEPNNPRLWKEIDRAIRGFLERLYRAGMLDGTSSDDAYFVRCDETTNPSSETDAGRVLCLIGIQPPYPAEFVVVRVGVTRSGIEVEEKGAQDV